MDVVAGAIGDPSRSAMLVALMPGRALTAGELSLLAGISAQNASGHLQKLLSAGLVAIEIQGRHRYYRLANAEIGRAIEALAAISSEMPATRRESAVIENIRFCRTCYDHLAGMVAAEITHSLIEHGCLSEDGCDFLITASGCELFANFGIDVARFRALRRNLARRCLDWTERRPHVSGALGAAILTRLIDLKWVAPIRHSRAMRITAAGRDGLERVFRLKRNGSVLGNR
jgi:DNA-binding transcriptional ArsR family regulator